MKYFLKFLSKLLICTGIIVGLFTFVFGIRIVYGNYMYPAIRDGDLVITYKLEPVNVGDVVLYEHSGSTQVGRVIASGGSKVSISDSGELMVNDGVLQEEIFYPTEKGTVLYPYSIPANAYFVMNDFRSDTNDSRTFQAISENNLEGKVIFVIRRRGF